jgi:hypothetical protein
MSSQSPRFQAPENAHSMWHKLIRAKKKQKEALAALHFGTLILEHLFFDSAPFGDVKNADNTYYCNDNP